MVVLVVLVFLVERVALGACAAAAFSSIIAFGLMRGGGLRMEVPRLEIGWRGA